MDADRGHANWCQLPRDHGGVDCAALATPPAEPGLDVERLARALGVIAIEDRDRVIWGDYSADTYVQHAERIAREYGSAPALPSEEELAEALHAMPHHYRGGVDESLARMSCEQLSPSQCEQKAAAILRRIREARGA